MRKLQKLDLPNFCDLCIQSVKCTKQIKRWTNIYYLLFYFSSTVQYVGAYET